LPPLPTTATALQTFVSQHWLTAIAGYGLIYMATVALSIPGAALLTVLGGFLFGWLIAGVLVVVAATAGATVVFLVARTSLGDVLARRAGPRLNALAKGFRDDAFNYLLFLRLVPVFPFWLVNIAPALFNVRLATFVTATLVGIVPGTFAFAFLGSGLDSIIAEQKAAYEACLAAGRGDCEMTFEAGALLTPELIIAFVALGVVALIPVVVRRVRARRGQSTAGFRSRHGNGLRPVRDRRRLGRPFGRRRGRPVRRARGADREGQRWAATASITAACRPRP
jgi:uncharacterized membrane protein YdjX (TVP38/TMEM64 family)